MFRGLLSTIISFSIKYADIIGVVVSKYKPQELDMNGVKSRLIDIVLQDVEWDLYLIYIT